MPNDPRFGYDQFANQSLETVIEAYQRLLDWQIEEAHRLTGPTANFALAMMRIHGQKRAEIGWFSPYPELTLAKRAKQEIDPETARLFLAAIDANICPSWARSMIDRELLLMAAKE